MRGSGYSATERRCAHATQANLMQQGQELVLLVEDNGRRFDAERGPEDGRWA